MNNDLKKVLAQHDVLMDEVNRLHLIWLQAQGEEKETAKQEAIQAQEQVNAHYRAIEETYPEAKKVKFWKDFYQTYRQEKEKEDSQRVMEILIKNQNLII